MGDVISLGFTIPADDWNLIHLECKKRNLSKAELLRPVIAAYVGIIKAQHG